MAPPTSPAYRMADRLTGGRLAELLAAYVAERRAWDDIARQLLIDAGIQTTGQTVASWAALLGLQRPDKAAPDKAAS